MRVGVNRRGEHLNFSGGCYGDAQPRKYKSKVDVLMPVVCPVGRAPRAAVYMAASVSILLSRHPRFFVPLADHSGAGEEEYAIWQK